MTIQTKNVRTLGQKIREWFRLTYRYYWNDFRDAQYYERWGLKEPGFKEKWRNLKYKLYHKFRCIRYDFRESFKWHVRCLIVFWKIPTALGRALDGLCASESLHNETYKKLEHTEALLETAIYYWADGSGEPNERKAYIEVYKQLYHERWKDHIPDEYLSEDESWDRAEIAYENGRLAWPGGPNCDYRGTELYKAKYYLKKNNFKSGFSHDFGGDDE